jgi:rhamnogalacturonyl hydrolase YesR
MMNADATHGHRRRIGGLALAAVLQPLAQACFNEADGGAPLSLGGAIDSDGDGELDFVRDDRRDPAPWTSREIDGAIVRVADWALENPAPVDVRASAMAPLYDGLIDASLVTGDPRYLAAVIRAGRRSQFMPRTRPYDADGHAAGHAWLRIYLMMDPKDPGLLAPLQAMFDEIADHPIGEKWAFGQEPPRGRHVTDRWTWSDALYMSPPTIALLAQATGNDRYLRFMDTEFDFAWSALFDVEASLWYRDARYVDERTPSGAKVFWSRGNACVYAGLALLLEAVPRDHPTRAFYLAVFRRMASAVLAVQQADGFWYPSLLDPEHVLIPETSGSALFVMAIASGVRRGLLDRDDYWPVVERGWKAITTVIEPDGAVTSVQPPGELPEAFDPSARAPYGTGAVLMAGAEILRAARAVPPVDGAELVRSAQRLARVAPDLSTECEEPCGSPDVPSGRTDPPTGER